MERSLLIIKPGFIKYEKSIVKMLEKMAGVKIVNKTKMMLSKDLLEKHYAEHVGKFFYGELTDYMSSGEVVVMIAEGGEGSIQKIREVCGATKNPAKGTIRDKYGIGEITRNVIHSSDSPENGEREILNFEPYLPSRCNCCNCGCKE